MRKPLTPKGWRNFKILAGCLDGIQIIVDFVPGYGEAANEILDVFIGITLAIIYWFKGAINLSAFIALLFSFFGEEVTAAAAPLWVLDVWYTQRGAPPSEQEQGAVIGGSYMNINNTNNAANLGYDPEGPLHQNVGGQNIRIPDNANQKPLNIKENGVSARPPRV